MMDNLSTLAIPQVFWKCAEKDCTILWPDYLKAMDCHNIGAIKTRVVPATEPMADLDRMKWELAKS